MNGLDTKVFVQSSKILVIGRLGHLYEVKVGYGQHGAPYSIKHVSDINPNFKSPLCIHSGRFADTIPLGDTIGSVVLSMVNDLDASRDIGSLHEPWPINHRSPSLAKTSLQAGWRHFPIKVLRSNNNT